MIRVDGLPIAFARPGRNRYGDRYTPRRYEEWKTLCAGSIKTQLRSSDRMIEGPVRADIVVRSGSLTLEISALADNTRPKGIRADLDNYVKAALDASQLEDGGGWIINDRQVVEIHARFGSEEK